MLLILQDQEDLVCIAGLFCIIMEATISYLLMPQKCINSKQKIQK